MIDKISIKRFKGIQSLDLDLAPINVIIGGNNAGKSSVLQAIQFAVSVAQTTSNQNVAWRGDRLPSSLSSAELVYAPISDIYALGHNGPLQEPVGEAINIAFSAGEHQSKVIVRKGRNKNISIAIEGKEIGEDLRNIDEPFSVIVPGLAGIPAREPFKTPSVIKRLAARGDSNSVFRNILLQLSKHQDEWGSFLSTLGEIYNGLTVSVEFNEDSDEYISVIVEFGGKTLPIDATGTGVLQAIQILSYIYLFKPKLLILDEPDSHLHPNNQRKLIEVLTTAQSVINAQILISTHSKYIVEGLIDIANVFWINGGALVDKIENEEEKYVVKSLMDIGALSEGESFGAQENRVTLITEDKDAKYIQLLIEANGWIPEEVEFWAYEGCSNLPVANALIKYIRRKRPGQFIVIHRDRDFMTDEEIEEYSTKLEGERIKVFFPTGNDLERYFYEKDHFLALYPEFNEDEYGDLIGEVIDENSEKLKVKLVNTRIDTLRKSGEKPNEGQVAVEYTTKFDNDKLRYSHGKIVLKAINGKLREKTGENTRLITVTDGLVVPSLQQYRDQIWEPNE